MNAADRETLARKVLRLAFDAGASEAEVIIREGSDFSASVRLQKLENLRQANHRRRQSNPGGGGRRDRWRDRRRQDSRTEH